jgi:hypothetical protein
VRGSEYPIMSTAKCASLADNIIVGGFSEVGKCFGYHPQVFGIRRQTCQASIM